MAATRGKSIGVQLRELFAKVGSFYPVRENFRLTPEAMAAFTEKLKADPKELSGARSSLSAAAEKFVLSKESNEGQCRKKTFRAGRTRKLRRGFLWAGAQLNGRSTSGVLPALQLRSR
jgi:hypothetical protein